MDSISLLLLFFFQLTAIAMAAPMAPCFFILGDSLVDNGNNNNRNTIAKVNYLPYGIDFPDGPTGRFNNGRNTADFLAELLGFETYIPPFADVSDDQHLLRGVNYGSGSGGISDESDPLLGDVINMNQQLANHETVVSKIAKLMGSEEAAEQHLSKCIYAVVIGSNDYIHNYLPKFYSSPTSLTPRQFAAQLIAQFSNQLKKLYYAGARKVAVFAIGRLGCIPLQIKAYGYLNPDALCVETSNDIVQIFNQNLETVIDYLNAVLPDAKFVYTSDLDPSQTSYGNITNVSEGCCEVEEGGVGACVRGAIPCSNRGEYYFWDSVHPTEYATSISAKVAFDNMSPLFESTLSMGPEITIHGNY